jgi:hypothetical protein
VGHTVGKARWINTSRIVIGHDGDEHGHDGHTLLGGGDLGPEPFADGLPDDPVATSASRLENLPNDPDKKPEPCNRRETDRDKVDHFRRVFTPSCHRLGAASHLKQYLQQSQTKRSPEGDLSANPDRAGDQAERTAWLRLRSRYAMKPMPTKPRSSIAHVEGSGTAVCIDSGFTTKLLTVVVAPKPKKPKTTVRLQ